MAEDLQQFMRAQFQAIRADIAALAASTVGIRRDLQDTRAELADFKHSVRADLERHSARIDSLGHIVGSMRADIQTFAIALQGQNDRLGRVEEHLALDTPKH